MTSQLVSRLAQMELNDMRGDVLRSEEENAQTGAGFSTATMGGDQHHGNGTRLLLGVGLRGGSQHSFKAKGKDGLTFSRSEADWLFPSKCDSEDVQGG